MHIPFNIHQNPSVNAISHLSLGSPALGCAVCGATDGVEVTDAPWQMFIMGGFSW